MKHYPILILSVAFFISCQNNKENKPPQKNAHDSTAEHKANAAIPVGSDSIDPDFVSYWKKFRTAAIRFDTAELISLSKFPVQTRGSLDSDPTIDYGKKAFPRLFKAFLNQWNGEDMNGNTELDVIKRIELPKKDDVHGDYARIGNLVFDKSSKNWKFIFVYLDDETIDSLNN